MRIKPLFTLLAVITLFLVSAFGSVVYAADTGAQKAILVTGASTGIGRRITEALADEGYFVFAGARKQADIDALNAIDNVQAVKLDVTIQEQIDAAAQTVLESGRGLHGLVNNAGIFIGGPLSDVDVEEFEWLMNVNVFGVYRVTQAFTPMILKSKGRITTIGSISGTGTGRYWGHYSMSKHAIEAYTDALATELEPLGVHVSVIEPGNYDSAIAATALNRMRSKSDQYAKDGSPFAADFRAWIDQDWDRSQYKKPDDVAQAALHALFADEPLRRYMVVPNEGEARWTIGTQMQELVQLNEWQAYSYSRDELIGILDEAMAPEDTKEAEEAE